MSLKLFKRSSLLDKLEAKDALQKELTKVEDTIDEIVGDKKVSLKKGRITRNKKK